MTDPSVPDVDHILDRIAQAQLQINAARIAQEHGADDKAQGIADLAQAYGGGKPGAEAAAKHLGVSATTVYKAVTRARTADTRAGALPAGWPERLLAAELAGLSPLPACQWQALAHIVNGIAFDGMWVESPTGQILAAEVQDSDILDDAARADLAAACRFWTRAQALAVIDACQRGALDELPTSPEYA